ncbi:MAG: spermidine synthase [Thermogutta sp.]
MKATKIGRNWSQSMRLGFGNQDQSPGLTRAATIRPRVPVMVSVLLVCVPGLVLAWWLQGQSFAADVKVLLEKESLYHYVRVIEEDGIRRLQFRRSGLDFEESAINIHDPLDFPLHYYKLMMAAFLHCPQPKSILFVGLGGGTLPQAIHHYFPEATLDAIELDPVVADAAKEFFGFRETPQVKIYVRDARVQMRQFAREKRKYDIIFLDAFRGGYIPYHLTTQEFMELTRSLLTKDGIVVSNLQPGFASYHYQRRTIARVFAEEWSYGRYGNVIVVSSVKPKAQTKEQLIELAERLQAEKKFQFYLPEIARMGTPGGDYVRSGPILTDDYAPTDVLRGIPQD